MKSILWDGHNVVFLNGAQVHILSVEKRSIKGIYYPLIRFY
jgi:hypothetical protein